MLVMFHSPLLSFVLYRRKTSLALLLPTDCSWSILQDLQQLSHHGVQLGLVEMKVSDFYLYGMSNHRSARPGKCLSIQLVLARPDALILSVQLVLVQPD
ncbi:hypothetical protein F2Q70_00001172 [Brassica cretica]|uniref:Uncharacterized protein n=1 Tax=Brassica cretica TaxID=69181 RepID=A0A8S9ITY6_BRACR|nr:hypothetical protein F2Q70_00001172 [Brassica cretica]